MIFLGEKYKASPEYQQPQFILLKSFSKFSQEEFVTQQSPLLIHAPLQKIQIKPPFLEGRNPPWSYLYQNVNDYLVYFSLSAFYECLSLYHLPLRQQHLQEIQWIVRGGNVPDLQGDWAMVARHKVFLRFGVHLFQVLH